LTWPVIFIVTVSTLTTTRRTRCWPADSATGLLFFAYTGYSRIATLVEEVRDPPQHILMPVLRGIRQTVPRRGW
jgi:hypothetical protein